MYTIVLLYDAHRAEVTQWDEAPIVRTWHGRDFSLRAGPRERRSRDGAALAPVAVYAPDELTEEEFQDLYYAHRPRVAELNLQE